MTQFEMVALPDAPLRATIAPMAPAFVAVALGLSRIMPYCSQRSIVPEWYSETMPPKPM